MATMQTLRRLLSAALAPAAIAFTLLQSVASSQGQRVYVPETAPTYVARDGDPVDLGTGLYVRKSIDLVLMDREPLVFSRTYRNRDTRSRPFGIGTNHSFGSFLVGDAPAITYIDLILPDGGRAHYRRIDGGTGHVGAVFEHTTTPSEYRNSRLFWDREGWTLRLRDGSVYTYPACPPALNKPCTMSSYRDAEGHEIRMRHDRRMNLVQIQSDQGSTIDLTYDRLDRIVLARSSTGQEVQYRYDKLGRLVQVTNSEGPSATYGYDAAHQMVQIDEPGISIKNAFDTAGRCILNDARMEVLNPEGRLTLQRFLFKFAYTVNAAGTITATDVEGPSSRRRVTFNERGYSLSDTVEGGGAQEFGTAFEREVGSNVVQRLTLWCGADRQNKVETTVDPESSTQTIRRIVELACRGARRDR
jgi:YD repeat-containing protein